MTVRDPEAPHKPAKDHSRREARYWQHRHEDEKLARREAANHAADDRAHHLAMSKVVLAAIPDHAPGVPMGQVLEAARQGTSRRMFPGDTHRMWAKRLLDELRAQGTVHVDADLRLWREPPRTTSA